MDKSYVTLATKYCPMCGEEWETGEILMDRQLKNRFDRHTMTGIALCEEHAALQRERDLILIMEGVDEGKACSGNALMSPRDLCHSLLKHLFAKAEDIPQSFVTEPEGYKMILNVAEAIRDSAESKD